MEAVIFVGIQAVGKSTFYRERFFRTHIHLNLDMLKTRHRQNILLQACIKAKQPFVVDNTNLTIEERAKYIGLAKMAHFRVVGYYFQSIAQDALRRNQTRTQIEQVPVKGVWGASKRLQLPTSEEGFDKLYYVTIGDNNDFIVSEWDHEL